MPFSQCSCTDTDGVDLNAHTTGGCSSHIGGVWTRQGGSTTNAAIFATNRARASTANVRCLYYHPAAPGDADYSVFADLVVRSNVSTSRAGVGGRMDSTSDTAYYARYDGVNWNLIKRVAGVQTSLITAAATLTVAQSYRLELRMVGTAISMYVDGAQIGTTQTDSSITAAGFAGLFLNDASPSDTTGYHLDNFRADDTPGGDPAGSTTATGHAGVVGQNVAQRVVSAFVVGGVGAEGQNVSRRTIAATGIGSIGAHGQNTVAPHGSVASAGSTGARGQSAASVTRISVATGHLGLVGRSQASLSGGSGSVTGSIITQGLATVALLMQGYGTGVVVGPVATANRIFFARPRSLVFVAGAR